MVFDELQWIANYRHQLVSDLKYVWDGFFAKLVRALAEHPLGLYREGSGPQRWIDSRRRGNGRPDSPVPLPPPQRSIITS